MRVTSGLFTYTLKNQLQTVQQRMVDLETQSATGLKMQKSSDNPLGYSQSQEAASNQKEIAAYLNSTSAAKTLVQSNYQAMSNIATLLSRAGELATKSTGYTDPSSLSSIGVEMKSILDQVVQIANQKSDGHYVFGGTGDTAPITGSSGSYAFSTVAAYTSNTTTTSVSSTNVVSVGLVAGQDNGGTVGAGFDGFLYQTTMSVAAGSLSVTSGSNTITGFASSDIATASVGQAITGTGIPAGTIITAIDSTTGTITMSNNATVTGSPAVSSATDVISTLQTLSNQLNTPPPISASQAQILAVNDAIDLNAQYVGRTSAQLSSLDLNNSTLTKLANSNATRLNDLSAANLADVLTDLQQTQTNYEAALQSGAKILTISLLDYIS